MAVQPKISIVGLEARNKVLKGANYIADAVKSTMGPFGFNVLIEKGNRVTNDGFTVSTEIVGSIKNEFERRGATILHEASAKTNDQVGDATSSSMALAQAILKESIKLLPNEKTLIARKTPSEVLRMIETSSKNVIAKLEEMATPIETLEQLVNSAKVSVEDEELAKMIGDTQFTIGKYGVINCEETAEPTSSIRVVKGLKLDNGFGTSLVVTNPEDQSLELANVHTILTNYVIQDTDIIALRDSIFKPLILQKKNVGVLFVGRAFSPEAIKLCMESANTGLQVFPINAPYTDQAEVMKDMAAVLGGRYIDMEQSALHDMQLSDVGFASKVVAKIHSAIVTGEDNEATQKSIAARVEVLEKRLSGEQSDFAKKLLSSRISQLTGGFAILKVGARTDVSRKRLKDKCDDAVNAVRLAYQGGTVKGAGIAFKEISESLEEGDILKKPLLAIYEQIMSSAPEDFVVEEWVRDPYLVLKAALENACSVASTLATTNAVIVTENPKQCNHGATTTDEESN
jgi:chaperonin GroEL